MTTKEKLLLILEKNRECSLSGEELAASLGVTRAAVWKAVRGLEGEGHRIEAAPNRGYRLLPGHSIFSAAAVLALLPENLASVHTYQVLDSTNNKAKELAAGGCLHGTAVIAEMQTGGRGRFSRQFASPPGGLYMSVVLRKAEMEAATLTAAAAVAVCRAVEAAAGLEPRVKWVNDVMLEGKKVCGILSEAASSLESGGVDWAVVGMGINITREAIPDELFPVAAALYETDPGGNVRARLAAEILKNLLPVPLTGPALTEEYRRVLSTLGQTVTVYAPSGNYNAIAEDIDDQCRLIVRLPGGERKVLFSGEISIKSS